jgi:hypothetical protein
MLNPLVMRYPELIKPLWSVICSYHPPCSWLAPCLPSPRGKSRDYRDDNAHLTGIDCGYMWLSDIWIHVNNVVSPMAFAASPTNITILMGTWCFYRLWAHVYMFINVYSMQDVCNRQIWVVYKTDRLTSIAQLTSRVWWWSSRSTREVGLMAPADLWPYVNKS